MICSIKTIPLKQVLNILCFQVDVALGLSLVEWLLLLPLDCSINDGLCKKTMLRADNEITKDGIKNKLASLSIFSTMYMVDPSAIPSHHVIFTLSELAHTIHHASI